MVMTWQAELVRVKGFFPRVNENSGCAVINCGFLDVLEVGAYRLLEEYPSGGGGSQVVEPQWELAGLVYF